MNFIYCMLKCHILLTSAAFFTTMISDKTTDFWIGFSNLANGRFKWTDGHSVEFADWAKGEPEVHVNCLSLSLLLSI